MTRRFVILHHIVAESEHWDLMLEHGDVLLTWRLAREPVDIRTLPIPARRMEDHRTAYLEYEGPIRGNRGHVTRVDQGDVNFERITGRCVQFELRGERLTGRFRLVEDGPSSHYISNPACRSRPVRQAIGLPECWSFQTVEH